MKIDVLVAEIGSTTTVVNAFNNIYEGEPTFLGQGQAPTSVLEGDVNIGLRDAIINLSDKIFNGEDIEYVEMFATSSAAGGLKMSVHGLVYDMTVKASKEAVLGAGGIIVNITAGKLMRTDIAKIKAEKPNIILVAGGVDFGERETAIYNLEKIVTVFNDVPIIYAGNVQNQDEVKLISEEMGVDIRIVENVYPSIDVLNVEPTRKVIQDVFEEHITIAKGMEEVRELVTGKIMPTPGAVMACAKLLYEEIGDLCVFDVGGATTDLHSVTNGSSDINTILVSPEPFAKRTVEGDLGVFVNIPYIIEKIEGEELFKRFENAEKLIINAKPIPETDEEIAFIEYLTEVAIKNATSRHAGRLVDFYSTSGKKVVATGKDLTAVKYIIGTGGALTRLPNGRNIMKQILENEKSMSLAPRQGAKVLLDNDYIMASIGVLSEKYPKQALILLKKSLNL